MYALFDLDGTLHNKQKSLELFAKDMYQRFLYELDILESDFCNSFIRENSIIQAKDVVFECLGGEFSITPLLQNSLLDYFNNNFHKFAVPFEGALEALSFLRSISVPIACVTNGRDFFQRNKISSLGLTSYFDAVVTSGELSIKKPDQRIFAECLNRLGATPEESVFVGDSMEADMAPAKRMGMKTVWFTPEGKAYKGDMPAYVDRTLTGFYEFPLVWKSLW